MSRYAALLEGAAEVFVLMVRELRREGELDTVKRHHSQLQRLEGEGDKLMLASLQNLYSGRYDPLAVMVMKDLLELLEKILDRCRDAGNVVFRILLKHS